MHVQVTAVVNGHLLSVVKEQEEGGYRDRVPVEGGPMAHAVPSTVRSSFFASEQQLLPALRFALDEARRAYAPDAPPLFGPRGQLPGVADGALAVLSYFALGVGFTVKLEYMATHERASLTLECGGAVATMESPARPPGGDETAAELYGFSNEGDAVEWTAGYLRELRERQVEDEADGGDEDGDEDE